MRKARVAVKVGLYVVFSAIVEAVIWEQYMKRKVAAIGEAMLEFAPVGRVQDKDSALMHAPATYQLAFAGDTFNTLFYYQYYAQHSVSDCFYVSALGDDAMSAKMLAAWQQYGVQTDLVARIAGQRPGLYVIDVDAHGERSFVYYRQHSAASQLCQAPQFATIAQQLKSFDEIYLSGISLAIYPAADIAKLYDALQQAKQAGAKIIFDTNYRPRLWSTAEQARQIVEQFYSLVDVVLPTFEDEQALFGDATIADSYARLQQAGIAEIVIKQGAHGCFVQQDSGLLHVPVEQAVSAVDTTAAGDSFNGSYLAWRAAGCDTVTAAQRAQQVAAQVVQHHGALITRGLPTF